MRDVSNKIKTLRTATAQATLTLSSKTLQLIHDHKIPKGNPLEVAKVAAIQAAKNTSQIIPYCHPLPIDHVDVKYELGAGRIDMQVTVKAIYKTGVEMEALTAASVAALTLYDMMKMLDESMEITGVKLLNKTGGKSNFKQQMNGPLRTAILVISDSVSAGKNQDRSGKTLVQRLSEMNFDIVRSDVVPDEIEDIQKKILFYADELKVNLVMTTGGTGLGPKDRTPQAVDAVIEQRFDGIAEVFRSYSQERTPLAMLSQSTAGRRGQSLILALPGSPSAVSDACDALFPYILHAFSMIQGKGHDGSN